MRRHNPEVAGQMPALQCLEHAGGNRGVVRPSAAAHRYAPLASSSPVRSLSEIEARETPRQPTGLDEFDRVLGGGAVAGAVVLIGGDPGIGKSTLLLQALASLSETTSVLYVTGEESAEQVALRARRLGWPPATSTCWPRSGWRRSRPPCPSRSRRWP